ncbi:MAG: hypothetical protein DRO12_04510 [Thermoprotei archaeon]|mgnify:CR=1 FL=1|nr:MAG: hypothetical protein DRO12_04510 [Thermoprotei archaeon]
MKAQLTKFIGGYVAVTLAPDKAIELIERLRERLGKGGEDVDDTIRMIKNFDVFYEFMRKKFKEFLTPKKNISDMIRANVMIDKIKLIKNGEKLVMIIFDRSVDEKDVVETLKEMNVEIEYVEHAS